MVEQSHLCIESRIFRHEDQVIDGVESKANGVKRLGWRSGKWELHSSAKIASEQSEYRRETQGNSDFSRRLLAQRHGRKGDLRRKSKESTQPRSLLFSCTAFRPENRCARRPNRGSRIHCYRQRS